MQTKLAGVSLLILLALAAVLAPPAAGQGGDGAAFDQYIENVSDPEGEEPSSEALTEEGDPLPPAAVEELSQLGPDGQQTAIVSAAITGGGDLNPDKPNRVADSAIETALGEVLGPRAEGLGVALPLILIGTVIAGLAFGLRRRLQSLDETS